MNQVIQVDSEEAEVVAAVVEGVDGQVGEVEAMAMVDMMSLTPWLCQATRWVLIIYNEEMRVNIRVGHAYAEYANDADYAHMRNMRMRMRIENLIHIIHI